MPPPTAIESDQRIMFLVSCGIHLSYFYLIKTFVPYIGKDRKRLSWVLTLVTGIVVAAVAPYIMYMTMRTTYHSPIPYSAYELRPAQDAFFGYQSPFRKRGGVSSSSGSTGDSRLGGLGGGSGGGWYRFDKIYEPTWGSVDRMESPSAAFDPEWIIEQEIERAKMVASFMEYDLLQVQGGKGVVLHRPIPRLLFDLRFMPSDSWLGQALVIFFLTYVMGDVALALLYYRERVSLFAGWIHHTLFTGFCLHTLASGEAHSFASYFIIEVPTVIMGLGHMDKRLRSDLLFGGSFFATRVVFFLLVTYERVMFRPSMSYSTKAILILCATMNCKFMVDWVNQQIRLRSKDKKVSEQEPGCEQVRGKKAQKNKKNVTSIVFTPTTTTTASAAQSSQSSNGSKRRKGRSKLLSGGLPLTECVR